MGILMSPYPLHFRFGIAESDLQSVGSLLPYEREGAHQPLWVPFSKSRRIEPPLYGAYKYERWPEDVVLLKNLSIQSYRTSISMSRTTDQDGNINTKAIQWYRKYFEAIKAQGIELHVALYHWEIPEHFGEDGVLHPDFPAFFARHVDIVLEYFSDIIDYYIPLNELWCITFLSYYVGIHVPGKKDTTLFFKALFRMLEIQSATVRQIKEHNAQHRIGIVNIHFPAYIPQEYKNDPSYQRACRIANQVTNYIYSDPFFFGTLDDECITTFRQYFPDNYVAILAQSKIAEHIDYYGVNYYCSRYVMPAENPLHHEQFMPAGGPVNELGWPISLPPHYPEGLTDFLLEYTRRYASVGLKNIIVSENGVPGASVGMDEQGDPADDFRIQFLDAHLQQVSRAIAAGAPVTGYFLWSLLDNFEWQESYKPESAFGLVAVEKGTGKRIPKKSYGWYKSVINGERI